ncbi:MAG: hypothetical protein AABY84_01365 [Candidatus Firestonebacteria bacterium]
MGKVPLDVISNSYEKYKNQLIGELPELTNGTIGFRNDGDEEALVRDIEVSLISPNRKKIDIWH